MTPEERAARLCMVNSNHLELGYSNTISCPMCKPIAQAIREAVEDAVMGEKEKQLAELRGIMDIIKKAAINE